MDATPLIRIGPPTALITTGDWREVVTLQIEMNEAHPNTSFLHLRGAKMRTAKGFLSEFAAVLQLPIWFGENWDALIDIMRDRAGFAGTIIAIYNAEELLADGSDADRGNLADVMEQCNRYWLDDDEEDDEEDEEADDEAFHLLFQVPPAEVEAFRERWTAAGLTIADAS